MSARVENTRKMIMGGRLLGAGDSRITFAFYGSARTGLLPVGCDEANARVRR